MSSAKCFACEESYNASTRKPVSCGSCQFTACRACYQKFILNTYEDPSCMQCHRPWTRRFMTDTFTNTFITGLFAEHRRNVLFEQERALLAYTQPFVERAVRAEEVTVLIEAERVKADKAHEEVLKLVRAENDIRARMRKMEMHRRNILGIIPSARETASFVRRCTAANCLGFLSSQWKCGVCSQWSCPDCFVVKGPNHNTEHVCDPDTLATARLIAADTKTCPKCGTGIFKTEGCNMMFCTECHTSFDWRTNAIITRNIHNPHYFEWRERTGNTDRDPTEVVCGRELDDNFVRVLFRTLQRIMKIDITKSMYNCNSKVVDALNNLYPDWHNFLRTVVQRIMEMREVLPGYATNATTDNLEIRISYMRNIMPVELFKREIARSAQKLERSREIGQVFGMVLHSVTDILHRLYFNVHDKPILLASSTNTEISDLPDFSVSMIYVYNYINTTCIELETLRLYVNDTLRDLSRMFNKTSIPLFAANFRLGTIGSPMYTTSTETTTLRKEAVAKSASVVVTTVDAVVHTGQH